MYLTGVWRKGLARGQHTHTHGNIKLSQAPPPPRGSMAEWLRTAWGGAWSSREAALSEQHRVWLRLRETAGVTVSLELDNTLSGHLAGEVPT